MSCVCRPSSGKESPSWDAGVWPSPTGSKPDLDPMEFSAWKYCGHDAATGEAGSDAVHERVSVDLCSGHVDSVDDGSRLAVDHAAGYHGCVLVPGFIAGPKLLPVLVHQDVVDVVSQEAFKR